MSVYISETAIRRTPRGLILKQSYTSFSPKEIAHMEFRYRAYDKDNVVLSMQGGNGEWATLDIDGPIQQNTVATQKVNIEGVWDHQERIDRICLELVHFDFSDGTEDDQLGDVLRIVSEKILFDESIENPAKVKVVESPNIGFGSGRTLVIQNAVRDFRALSPELPCSLAFEKGSKLSMIYEDAVQSDTIIGEIVFPELTDFICHRAFASCTRLKKVHVPSRCHVFADAFSPETEVFRYEGSVDSIKK